MTQQEAIDALTQGATNTDAKYVNVLRETLLLALGVTDERRQES